MSSESFDEIVETFEFLDDWEDRYRHVIDLGRAMPDLAENQKNSLTKVDGCASQVWIVPQIEGEGPDARLYFSGDSDAMIVRGLIAVLHALLNGQPVATVRQTDAMAEMARLGLDQHLSAQRSNGLRAMVARLKDLAAAAA